MSNLFLRKMMSEIIWGLLDLLDIRYTFFTLSNIILFYYKIYARIKRKYLSYIIT